MAATKDKSTTKPLATPLPKGGRATGRPSSYRPEYAQIAERLTLLDANLTDVKIAEFFRVSMATLSKWKVDHIEFSEAIARAKLPADGMVANALFRRAIGYDYTEESAVKVKDKNGLDTVKIVTLRKHLAPDFNSVSLWLRNRQSSIWKAIPEESKDEDESAKTITGITVTVRDMTKKVDDDGDSMPSSATDSKS
jgi:hypothetical protein